MKDPLQQGPFASLKNDAAVGGIDFRVRRYDTRTEELFKYVQVSTAILDLLSHGANDVASATCPFIAEHMTWENGGVVKKSEAGATCIGSWRLAASASRRGSPLTGKRS